MNNRLLSIGSVVLLKEIDKKVMVIGYYPTFLDGDNEITYDYSGCLFPEGIISSEEILVFNKEDIDKLIFNGLINEEQNDFIIRLNQAVEEEKKSITSINQNISLHNQQQQQQNQSIGFVPTFNTIDINEQNNNQ